MSSFRRQQEPDRLLRLSEVLERCPFSKAQLYTLIKKHDFPRPVRIGLRSVAWRESDVRRWIATRPDASEDNWR